MPQNRPLSFFPGCDAIDKGFTANGTPPIRERPRGVPPTNHSNVKLASH